MSKENPTAYDVQDEELVTRLMNAAARAGTSTSGLCIDVCAGVYVADMHYYKGVVLARLAGEKPPYEPHALVVVCNERGVSAKELWNDPGLPFKQECVVERVWYVRGKWYLELKGIRGQSTCPLYRASAFRHVKLESAPTTAPD